MAGESAREKAQRAREKSERLVRYADAWEKGADGESQTAAALARLGPEWTAWHDLKWPGRRFANIDHLVIGPAGIFVIDSKNWSGAITVKESVLRQNGYRREPAVAGCADSALAVGELLPRYLDRTSAVLCFVRDEPVQGWVGDVMLCSTANIVESLTRRATVLGTDEIADAEITLQARMDSKIDPERENGYRRPPTRRDEAPHVDTSARALNGSARTGPATRNRRLKRSLKRLVTGIGAWWLATMLLVLTVGPLTNYSDNVLGPATIGLGLGSWILMRRLIR